MCSPSDALSIYRKLGFLPLELLDAPTLSMVSTTMSIRIEHTENELNPNHGWLKG